MSNPNYNNERQAMSMLCAAIIRQGIKDKDYEFFLKDSPMLDIVLTLSEVTQRDLAKYNLEEKSQAEILKKKRKALYNVAERIRGYMDGTKTAKEIAEIAETTTGRVYDVYRHYKNKGYTLKRDHKGKAKKNKEIEK